jgi:CheY-like chemotaxis protein
VSAPDRTIFPYFHPTTVFFVDDNTNFLNSLDLHLPAGMAYHMFAAPAEAIARLNAGGEREPLYLRCLSRVPGRSADGTVVRLDMALIEQEVANPDRFREVSVAVVDYAMPSVDGLEFCKRIANPRVKKILLTGVADEKVAVRAFNEGIIDRFIMKSQPDAIEVLKRSIGELQRRYFADISAMLANSLFLARKEFLDDAVFQDLFAQLVERHGFVEYYLVDQPSGFLLLRGDGSLNRLVVLSERELNEQLAFARSHGVPRGFLDDLADGRSIAYFYDEFDDYFDPATCDWRDYFHRANRIEGRHTWFYALLDDPPVDIEFDPEASNFRRYLDVLDGSPGSRP